MVQTFYMTDPVLEYDAFELNLRSVAAEIDDQWITDLLKQRG